MSRRADTNTVRTLPKCPTGVAGLDAITEGGFPLGRPTLVCGGPGCGKTLLAMHFLVRGATELGEPGVLMSFEETGDELAANVASLGYDLKELIARKKLAIDYVRVVPGELEVSGEYDLEALFIRLDHAIKTVKAKRVVLDTVECLFGALANPVILRAELHRLFRWLKERGVTAVITGERGENSLTRQGLEEYTSDCVILLDHRVTEQVSTRRLRIVKYRGSFHGTNEYPFLIDRHGISVLPVTTAGLDHAVSTERVPTGIARLDAMLGGQGVYRGSSVLVSGTAGTGKTTIAAQFVAAACARGERCLYFAFEEAPNQIVRNVRSVGIDLAPPLAHGTLEFHATRPSACGLELHLLSMHAAVDAARPAIVVVDPVTSFIAGGNELDVRGMLLRLIDYLKAHGITLLMTSLTSGAGSAEATDTKVSSLVDTWLVLRDLEVDGERNRGLTVLKSRGMAHSNQVRELMMTDEGIDLRDVYVGPGGVLTGSARSAQETAETAAQVERLQEIERLQRALESKRRAFEAQVAQLQAGFDGDEAELRKAIATLESRERGRQQAREQQARTRFADKP